MRERYLREEKRELASRLKRGVVGRYQGGDIF